MAEKKLPKSNQNPQVNVPKRKTFSEGQIKDKPLIDKISVQPPPATKPKK
jgi:hypothetical protein